MRNVNLTVVSLKGATQNRGKVVQFQGRWIHHQWIQGKWLRRDIDAWGMDSAVLDYLEKHGVQDVYLYVAAQGKTYHAYVGAIRKYGTPANRKEWGENLNLPIEEWTVIDGKLDVPWVPASASIRLRPNEPKPLVVKEEIPVREVDDALAQSTFF